MSDAKKEQKLGGPRRPEPVVECRTRLDSVLASFSKRSLPGRLQPQQKQKNK